MACVYRILVQKKVEWMKKKLIKDELEHINVALAWFQTSELSLTSLICSVKWNEMLMQPDYQAQFGLH